MTRYCRAATYVLLALYAVALAIFLVSAFKLFGVEGDVMSSVFLLLMGQPWIGFADLAREPLWPWMLALLPLVNIALLGLLCSLFAGRGTQV